MILSQPPALFNPSNGPIILSRLRVYAFERIMSLKISSSNPAAVIDAPPMLGAVR